MLLQYLSTSISFVIISLVSQIDMSANERNVLKIRHTDDDVITALQTLPEDDEEPNNNNNNNNNNKRVDNNFDYTTNPNFDGTAKQLLDEERHHKVERDQTKTNQTKTESLSKQKTANKPKKCRRISENFEGKRQSNTGMKRNLSVTFNFSSSLATENLDSVIAEKPEINHEQMPDELHIDHESRTNSHDSQIVSVSQSQEAYDRDYFPENPLPFDAQSTSNFIDRYVAEQQRLSEARLFDNNEDNYFIEDYNLMPLQPQNKQYKRKKRKKKHKINPSHQLNTISSIQVNLIFYCFVIDIIENFSVDYAMVQKLTCLVCAFLPSKIYLIFPSSSKLNLTLYSVYYAKTFNEFVRFISTSMALATQLFSNKHCGGEERWQQYLNLTGLRVEPSSPHFRYEHVTFRSTGRYKLDAQISAFLDIILKAK